MVALEVSKSESILAALKDSESFVTGASLEISSEVRFLPGDSMTVVSTIVSETSFFASESLEEVSPSPPNEVEETTKAGALLTIETPPMSSFRSPAPSRPKGWLRLVDFAAPSFAVDLDSCFSDSDFCCSFSRPTPL